MGQPALQNEIFLEADLLQEMIEHQSRSQEINGHRADWIITELESFLNDQGYPIKEQQKSVRIVTCPKVPPMLRKGKRSKEYFDPRIFSFGPYHHGKPELQEGETLKTKLMLEFIKESGKSVLDIHITGDENEEKASVHLLECIHKELSSDQNVSLESCHFFNFCKIWSTQTEEQEYADFIQSFRSVRELKTKGIHFKPINSSFLSLAKLGKSISLRNVEFRSRFISAELKLPPLFLDPAKIKVYNNLAAFEWCPPTVNALVITSYICFLNTLIDGPDDVRELRSKRILLNNVGSDQEVLKMLREMTTFERQDVALYQGVRKAIEKHYNNKIRTWVAEIINKYFSTPLAALGLFGAITFLVLAIVQTRFTIYPIKEK